MIFQSLTLTLDGMTAGDYLSHIRDPEPPSLGRDLRAVEVRADPIGDVVEVLLAWEDGVTPPERACALAGFPLPAEVVRCETRRLPALERGSRAA